MYRYRLGIRRAVAAPLNALSAVLHPADTEEHLFWIACSFSEDTWREGQVASL